jgi:transposase-like protein
MSSIATDSLVQEYAEKIRPLLPLAKKAYGSRTQDTPAHSASREYTRLLVEFHELGGPLTELAKELGVAYAGLRRRVVMRNVSVSSVRSKPRGSMEGVQEAVQRIQAAKSIGVDAYHDQLAAEYRSGISLAGIARELGLYSSAPLYYGVQRSLQRHGIIDENATSVRVSPTMPSDTDSVGG